jgi:hypothetical protein
LEAALLTNMLTFYLAFPCHMLTAYQSVPSSLAGTLYDVKILFNDVRCKRSIEHRAWGKKAGRGQLQLGTPSTGSGQVGTKHEAPILKVFRRRRIREEKQKG